MVNIMDRPNFIDIKNAEEFEEYYWYKEELVVICREIGIDSLGTKFELEERLKNYIRGIKTESNRKKNHNIRQKKMADINLEMKLIPEGFKFNKEAREFFCNYFVTHFLAGFLRINMPFSKDIIQHFFYPFLFYFRFA